jgi:hypothetical protein
LTTHGRFLDSKEAGLFDIIDGEDFRAIEPISDPGAVCFVLPTILLELANV